MLDKSDLFVYNFFNFLSQNGDGNVNEVPLMKEKLGNSKISPTDKNPVMLLNELYPAAKYEILSESGEQLKKFTTVVIINDKRWV